MATVQMKVIGGLILALCLIIPMTSARSHGFSYCNDAGYPHVKVSGLEINPCPSFQGQNATFQIAAFTNEPISGGKFEVLDICQHSGICAL